MALTIKARKFCPRGQVFLMPNVDHPEVDLLMTLDDAEHVVLICHPDNEQAVRDAVALEQERPRWWRVQQEWDRLCEAIRYRP